MSLGVRIGATAAVVVGYGLSMVHTVLNSTSFLVTGESAARQLDNSDAAYVTSNVVMNHFNHLESYSFLVVIALLVAIWWTPVKNALSTTKETS